MTIDSRLEALGWHHRYSGKVRDLYESAAHPGRLLVVTSDRVSAFDHILSPGIPGKGALLTQLSLWWFGRLGEPTHLAGAHPSLGEHLPAEIAPRTMIVHALEMYPIECVVRGYLAGSGWAEYRATQSVCGIPLPAGLEEGDELPEPIFTPAFKAPLGTHDENITFERMTEIVGAADAEALRAASLRIFNAASEIAQERGILLADTKF
ncbi:MAG TPA: phosphoribosylaminoimidazolesuccinocarboxamide synthase, partial [Pseudolysinimonas sp.]|nr:phosphoribosylaminoimidazolesuccinocarboxamide synthase [Pseudolysinimonas sp.]